MPPGFYQKIIVFAALSALITHASLHEPRKCSETLSSAFLIADELQSKYWNSSSGSYAGGELWTDANTLEDLHNLMLVTGSDTYATLAEDSYIGQAALNPCTDWNSFLYGSYDDAQWIILALWRISDYKASRGLDCSEYMSSSLVIYDFVATAWDDTCGGGVWWSSDRTYKNAITNELFLLTSAQAYSRTGNETYLENALKEYAWLSQSGMQGSDGLFNDGLDLETCQNNGATAWSYNQAVVASGLGALYVATGGSDTSYLEQAQVSLDATIVSLTSDGILKESCDAAQSNGKPCNQDQQLFKGIWMKHVQYFLDSANDASITDKYSEILGLQFEAIYAYALSAEYDVGSVWYAPDKGGSQWGSQASASGLEAAISASQYAACQCD